jgi:outer membrane protein OmpA-like peptidoglycan-associated protein
MRERANAKLAALAIVVMLPLMTIGCATKKYVSKMVSPLETRLGKNEAKTDQNSKTIKDVDDKATEGINAAQGKADEASQQATKAGDAAQTAQLTAQKGVDQANAVDQKVENADNFRTVKTATVLFAFNKSELTDEDTQQLDQLAEAVKSMKHFVIQVQGFTDATGPKAYNLQLSRRRADAVVRYLTEKHDIPLVKIALLGYGEDSPVAPNNTHDGRKANRRVDIKVLAPEWAAGQVQAQAQTPSATTGDAVNK